ncbi:hypothetical protein Hdeb2414_s0002g00068481 [Helianthus debilis subsp. tardiflorus]
MDLHDFSPGSRKRKKALHAVVLTVVWCIWKTRNEVLFHNDRMNAFNPGAREGAWFYVG